MLERVLCDKLIKMKINNEDFNREVINRQGKIRYYSGFNLEGFFKGYDKVEKVFDKSKISPQMRVWFYTGHHLICSSYNDKVKDIGALEDYKQYFLDNLLRKQGSSIMNAAGSSLSRVGSRGIPFYVPCVFSGLIEIADIEDAHAGTSWFCSVGPQVPVDRLYEVELITLTKRKIDILRLKYSQIEKLRSGPLNKVRLKDITKRL